MSISISITMISPSTSDPCKTRAISPIFGPPRGDTFDSRLPSRFRGLSAPTHAAPKRGHNHGSLMFVNLILNYATVMMLDHPISAMIQRITMKVYAEYSCFKCHTYQLSGVKAYFTNTGQESPGFLCSMQVRASFQPPQLTSQVY